MSYGRSPQRIPRDGTDRLLERLKSLEARLSGIERRGSSATWTPDSLAAHASNHFTGGSDPLTPGSIGAATSSNLSAAVDRIDDLEDEDIALDGRLDALEAAVPNLPTTFATTITGDGSDTTFTVTHNGGTRDCQVSIREIAAPYAVLDPTSYTVELTTTNTADLTFNTAPANAEELRVLIVIF